MKIPGLLKDKKTLAYAWVQGTFWMNLCVIVVYASVLMLGYGYTNAELGIVVAAGSIFGALLGPFLASFIDRTPRVTASRVIPPVLALQMCVQLFITFFGGKNMGFNIAYAISIALCNAMNSLILKQYADAEHQNQNINFPIARGIGSIFYLLLSTVLGALVEATSIHVIPYAGIFTCLCQISSYFLFSRACPLNTSAEVAAQEKGHTMKDFLLQNKQFSVMLLGCALIFFSHNALCNYLINVTKNVGGNTQTMGSLNAFTALMELPVMLLMAQWLKKKNSAKLLTIAFLFFVIKAAAYALASSVSALFVFAVLQAPSYALYTVTIVPYIIEKLPYEDSAKAQSLAYTMNTVGAVLSSLIAGRLYDQLSVTATLWILCAVCAAGCVIACMGVQGRKSSMLERNHP